MITPLKYVSNIKPYVPGKPIKELERELGITDSIKLASNENPLGPSPEALKSLQNFIQNGTELSRYPDGGGYYLKKALSEKLNVDMEQIILGNGSNELIDIAVRTFLGCGDKAIMATPSFVVYSMVTNSVGAIPVEIPLLDYRHNLQKMADAIDDKTKIIFIANPNNPTGTINRRQEFEMFMDRVPDGVLVIVDEAYFEYVIDKEYPDTFKYFREGRDILILRTFSKIYGLAGLRIGYGIAKKELITEMNRIREPFNTNTLAQIAATNALKDEEHVKKSIKINEEGKRFLYNELSSIGVSFIPTEANFIYMPLSLESENIYNALLKMGVIVRPVGKTEIRVTIGLPEENKRFIEALKLVNV